MLSQAAAPGARLLCCSIIVEFLHPLPPNRRKSSSVSWPDGMEMTNLQGAVLWDPQETQKRTSITTCQALLHRTSHVISTKAQPQAYSSYFFLCLQLACILGSCSSSLNPHSFLGFVFYTRSSTERKLLLIPVCKLPREVSISIPNLVSWWAHKLLLAKIAVLAKISLICLDVH